MSGRNDFKLIPNGLTADSYTYPLRLSEKSRDYNESVGYDYRAKEPVSYHTFQDQTTEHTSTRAAGSRQRSSSTSTVLWRIIRPTGRWKPSLAALTPDNGRQRHPPRHSPKEALSPGIRRESAC